MQILNEIFNKKIYERDCVKEILRWIDDREIIVITGPRQSGKTSLLYFFIRYLIENKIATEKSIYFYDAEDPKIADFFSSGIENIISEISPEQNKKKYVFIDEAHYIKDAGKTLKYIVDHYGDQIKFFISGSSSLEISKNFKESMVGRKIIFVLYPLNFGEFLVFKDKKNLREKKLNIGEKEEIKILFNEFCIYGGFPRVVLENDLEKKKNILNEIYSSYIRKDIASLFGISVFDKFNKFLKYIAVNSGQIFNINSATINIQNISRPTIERYLNILEGTFIINKINPYYGNKNKEIIKMGKVYFIDNGIRNIIINNFNSLENRTDAGALLEIFALRNMLDKYKKDEIKFYRTKSGLEVDFIIDKSQLYAIEVKKNGDSFKENYFIDFIKRYKINEFIIFNLTKNYIGDKFKYYFLYEIDRII